MFEKAGALLHCTSPPLTTMFSAMTGLDLPVIPTREAVSRSRADVEIERPAMPPARVDRHPRAPAVARFSDAGAWTGVPIGG